ncbi:unnamed protein product [Owenia fusiformis]|uniref:Uncharacterized protein n=1 Tax=Owenia fusiformis TaxID=6347 RepID=A0A8J1YCI8_OWEFU|nr:unnamed protein product [Owenia fusiformis]
MAKVLLKGLSRETSCDGLEMFLENLLEDDDEDDLENEVTNVELKANGKAIVTFEREIEDINMLQKKLTEKPLDAVVLQCSILEGNEDSIGEEDTPSSGAHESPMGSDYDTAEEDEDEIAHSPISVEQSSPNPKKTKVESARKTQVKAELRVETSKASTDQVPSPDALPSIASVWGCAFTMNMKQKKSESSPDSQGTTNAVRKEVSPQVESTDVPLEKMPVEKEISSTSNVETERNCNDDERAVKVPSSKDAEENTGVNARDVADSNKEPEQPASSPNAPLETIKVEVSYPKIMELLKKENILEDIKEQYTCKARTREKEVIFESTDSSKLGLAKLNLIERIRDIEDKSKHCSVSPGLMNVFHKNDGLKVFQKNLEEAKFTDILASIKKGKITFFSMNEKHIEASIAMFEKLFIDETMRIESDCLHLTQSEQWKKFVNQIHKEFVVSVAYESNQPIITVAGVKKDVEQSIPRIKEYMRQNHIIEFYLEVPPDTINHFRKFGKEKLLKDIANRSDISLSFDTNKNKYAVKGVSEKAKAVKAKWDALSKTVQSRRFTVDKPGMGGFLVSTMGRALLNSVESELTEVTTDIKINRKSPYIKEPIVTKSDNKAAKASSTDDSSTDPNVDNNPARDEKDIKPTADATSGPDDETETAGPATTVKVINNITMTLVKGDISKQKADVLVNSCSRSLMDSPTTKAFLKEGGDEFGKGLEDIKSTLEDGKAKYGDVFVSDAGSKLQANYTIHAVCPPFKTNPRGLTDVFTKCFEEVKKKGKCSLAVPAIGGGKSGYSNQLVWESFCKALSSIDQTTTLTSVSFVVFGGSSFSEFCSLMNGKSPPKARSETSGTKNKEEVTLKTHTVYGNITLTFKQGDIAAAKDEILVNVLEKPTDNLQKTRSVIAKAFLDKGGPELTELVKGCMGTDTTWGDVLETTTTGSLQCTHVLHAIPTAFKYDSSGKKLKALLEKLLEKTSALGKTGIALPPIGTGRLSHYPTNEFYRALDDALKTFSSKTSSIKTVTVYVFDRQMLGDLLNKMSGTKATTRGTKFAKNDHRHGMKQSQVERRPVQESILTVPIGDTVDICLIGYSKEVLKTAEKKITDIVDDYYVEDKIMREQLTVEEVLSVMNAEQKSMTFVEKCQSGHVLLRGAKSSVEGTANSIRKKIEHDDQMGAEMFQKGTKEYLQAIAQTKNFSYPSYWKKKKPKKHCLEEVVDPKLKHEIEKICQVEWGQGGTWKSGIVGNGSDARGLTHTNIKIKKIQSVQNPQQFKKYNTHQQAMCKKAVDGDIHSIGNGELVPFTSTLGVSSLDSLLVPQINECFLFHGAKPESVDGIVSQGPDSRLTVNSMMGNGVYMAESSTKADQYADPKDQRSGGEKKMFLMRAQLGNIHVANEVYAFRRPPCVEYGKGCNNKICSAHTPCDSVLAVKRPGGAGRLLFREFIVYDNSQVYPEFLITYERI